MSLKIYFAGSIRGGRENREIYAILINYLSRYGEVLTEHIGDPAISEKGEENIPDEVIYERDMNWLDDADVLIAEVSNPSLGVGYEIAKAESLGKRILCLFNSKKNLSAMIKGNPFVEVRSYETLDDAFSHIDDFFKAYH